MSRLPVDRPSVRGRIAPFLVMDVMDDAARVERAGHSVLHLEVGQPGTRAPKGVIEAAHHALDHHQLGYQLASGDPELRERIARHYVEAYGCAVDEESIAVTNGASGALTTAFLSAFEAGDRVALTVPGYPCYTNILHALDLEPVALRVGPESGYQLTAAQLAAVDPVPRGLVLGTPANPTGSIVPPDELARILAVCDERGIVPIIDEIYHGLTYETDTLAEASHPSDAPVGRRLQRRRTPTAASISPRAWVINSFSKYFSMTGFRLGWMIVPEPYQSSVERLTQNLSICAPTLSQRAALAAFDAEDELQGHLATYRRNRAVLLEALSLAGITELAPADGAFYLYADISHLTNDSPSYCARMLEEIHVATTPGTDFDPERGHHMLRLSYCIAQREAEEAALRLTKYLSR